MTERFPTDNDLQCAWDGYVEAKQLAERTQSLSDGIMAGRMWRRFIYLFADPEKITADDNNVVRLPSRRERQSRGQAI